MRIIVSLLLLPALLFVGPVWAVDPELAPGDSDSTTDVLAGHSFHGEAFNEGPRQAAYLMSGMGHVQFETSTTNELAQRFINQGIAQLHGFWYYEAERSFRQAAVLDPQCGMCYWGMALANVENRKRSREFIAQAVALKSSASEREKLYIEAWEKYCRDEDDKGKKIEKKDRAEAYTRDLESIVLKYPQDVEGRAFLALQLWQNERNGLPIVSHLAIDSVLQDVFDADPMHPAHHYRIHLWDRPQPENAVASAALCGQSLPGIAHMWHMPGHIYSKLHRYHDAVWQQEASARVDHAHMMRDRVLPDQIHNFAHNNEWLIRNLIKIGRVDDALALAKNMLELPRHPKYNTLKKGSAKYGRERLLLVLSTYRLWPELIEFAETEYLQPGDDAELTLENDRYLGIAFALNDQSKLAADVADKLATQLSQTKSELDQLQSQEKRNKQSSEAANKEAADKEATDESEATAAAPAQNDTQGASDEADKQKAEANRKRREKERTDRIKQLNETQKQLEKAIASVQSAQAAAEKDWAKALELWEKSDLSDKLLKAEWLAQAGKVSEALELLDKDIEANPGEVPNHAVKTWLLYLHQGRSEASATFEVTAELAATADLNTPLLARLLPVAVELDHDEQWANAYQPAADTGQRPPLDTLGPFRWHPYMAPDFAVLDTQDSQVQLKQFSGKPTLVIFYLGFGCLHCIEQLHEFSPQAARFRESGIDIIAISTEELGSLRAALDTYSKPLDIPLHADPELLAFKAYRCFDDFEQQPLHGTFLIDPSGRVLWQDISYEPFMDVEFVMRESHRLLELAGFGHLLMAPKSSKFTSR